jgi:hypothetical protein
MRIAMKKNSLTTLSLHNLSLHNLMTLSTDDTNELAGISTEDLTQVTGGYHDPVPSDTGTAGLHPAPCTPSTPSNPNPKPSPVWILI